MRTLFIPLAFALISSAVHGQPNEEVEVWTFDELESYISRPDPKLKVVNFWATWCAPCIKELPLFESVRADHRNRVDVLLVSLDFADQKDKKVIPFIANRNIVSKVIILGVEEYNVWIEKIDNTWSGAIPATLMVLPDGEKRFYEKEFEGSQLKDLVSQLLIK